MANYLVTVSIPSKILSYTRSLDELLWLLPPMIPKYHLKSLMAQKYPMTFKTSSIVSSSQRRTIPILLPSPMHLPLKATLRQPKKLWPCPWTVRHVPASCLFKCQTLSKMPVYQSIQIQTGLLLTPNDHRRIPPDPHLSLRDLLSIAADLPLTTTTVIEDCRICLWKKRDLLIIDIGRMYLLWLRAIEAV